MRCRHSIRNNCGPPQGPSRRAPAPAETDDTVAQLGTDSPLSKIPFGSSARAIGRAKLCHHLTQWLCHKGWSAAVAYLLAKVLLILVTTLSH
jgi:hypothetical protein